MFDGLGNLFKHIKDSFKPKVYTTGWKKVYSADGKVHVYDVYDEGNVVLSDSIFDAINMRCGCGATLQVGKSLFTSEEHTQHLVDRFLEAHKGHTKERVH